MQNKRTGTTHRVRRGVLRTRRQRERAVLARSIGAIEPLEARRLLSTTWYVDAAASGASHDGTSWTSAYTDLQQALASAVAGDAIHVAQGTYKPTTTNDRTISFQLKNGVEIDGGYAGYGAANPEARDLPNTPSLLSGDIGVKGNNSDNSFHVVVARNIASAKALDGFRITGGNATGNDIPTSSGGGLYAINTSTTIINCTFIANTAGFGAGLYQEYSSLVLDSCTLTNNTTNSYGAGGGVWSFSSPNSAFTNCAFVGNSSFTGGGMFNNASALTVTNCTFQNNTTPSYGGSGAGMYNENASPKLTGCTFTGSTIARNAGDGGAIYNYGTSSAVISACAFSENSASYGGAIRNDQYASPLIESCTFSSNTASQGGGAIYSNGNCAPVIVGCSFQMNSAAQDGGAIYSTYSTPTLRGCTFVLNRSSNEGGAIENGSGAGTITSSLFAGNTASGFGGGAIYNVAASPEINGCLFVGNSTASSGGGVYNDNSSSPVIVNCTFTNNVGSLGGAICNRYSSAPTLSNCMLWNDVASNGNEHYESLGATLASGYSDIQGGYAGAGNIDADPLFYRNPSAGADGTWGTADDDYGDLHLQPGSPCIDAGSNAAVPSDVTTDLDGNPRILDFPGVHDPGAIVDMGAYEAVDLDGMHLTAGQHLVLPAGHRVFSANGLIIDSGATLDIKDNSLIINYPGASSRLGSWDSSTGQYNGLTGQIQSGAIFSSLAQPRQTTLGIAAASNLFGISGSQTATWGGQTVGSIDVLIKFTYVGDANLDGKVNIDDYGRIDANVGQSGNVFGWYAGDFNFDGKINIDDYGLIDSIIGAQGPVL